MELNTSAAAPACKIEVTHGPWRRHMPSFDIPMVNHPTAKRLDALLSGHNWNRNRFIRKLRKEGATLKRRKLADGTWKTKYIATRRASI
ncbi:hypothetical protein P3522_24270, partial [Vibrio parahaemolyticus]|nr:hypothetical protein [Vibrio parahaemolyticus]